SRMTLYRQLLIFNLLLFILLFTGTWLLKLQNTRVFLLNQLESHAQDTATSLGIVASHYVAERDLAAVETLLNAVADRGYYRAIRLLDLDNKIMVERVLPVTIEGVPEWFVKVIPLQTPEASSLVMNNWLHLGMLEVESHPGYAYKMLWQAAKTMSFWFSIAFAAVSLGGALGLHVLLRPLGRVEQQARAICERRYEIQEKIPRTRELRRVVEAMNRMTDKVRAMFEEHSKVAERLRDFVYRDELTGLGNRRYLDSQVAARFEVQKHTYQGSFLIVHIHDLAKINQLKGYRQGDELLLTATEILLNATSPYADRSLSRLNGGEFGIFLPSSMPQDCTLVAKSIMEGLRGMAAKGLTVSENIAHIGAVTYDQTISMKKLLVSADFALREAERAGINQWKIHSIASGIGGEMQLGQQKWKEVLLEVLRDKDRLVLYRQPVVFREDPKQLYHLEVFVRIEITPGNIVCAKAFMPLAERFEIMAQLDAAVLQEVASYSKHHPELSRLAINISPVSLTYKSFWDTAMQTIRELEGKVKLYFEFSEYGAIQHMQLLKKFAAGVRLAGHGIGLDNFGQSFNNFGYLQSLSPDYLKIDRGFTGELQQGSIDSRFFISTLCSVAHSLDIDVIAEGIEDEKQWAAVTELAVDGVQGYYVGKPEAAIEEA
ncbi:MAG: EAL domain-containing protein, partial [Desulfobulbaceae bacterium]|nr:EAL domain-containing protein [Desulfobulbaceae bacterium]